jgi:hypothetical protein
MMSRTINDCTDYWRQIEKICRRRINSIGNRSDQERWTWYRQLLSAKRSVRNADGVSHRETSLECHSAMWRDANATVNSNSRNEFLFRWTVFYWECEFLSPEDRVPGKSGWLQTNVCGSQEMLVLDHLCFLMSMQIITGLLLQAVGSSQIDE